MSSQTKHHVAVTIEAVEGWLYGGPDLPEFVCPVLASLVRVAFETLDRVTWPIFYNRLLGAKFGRVRPQAEAFRVCLAADFFCRRLLPLLLEESHGEDIAIELRETGAIFDRESAIATIHEQLLLVAGISPYEDWLNDLFEPLALDAEGAWHQPVIQTLATIFAQRLEPGTMSDVAIRMSRLV